jgi:hypothetical protein
MSMRFLDRMLKEFEAGDAKDVSLTDPLSSRVRLDLLGESADVVCDKA